VNIFFSMKSKIVSSVFLALLMQVLVDGITHGTSENVSYLEFVEKLSPWMTRSIIDTITCSFDEKDAICSFINKPGRLTSDIMANFKNVEQLNFNLGNMSEVNISNNALENLSKLKELNMRNIFVKAAYFVKLNSLKIIYAVECVFEDVDQVSFFENLYHLEELWISLSHFTTVTQKLFKNLGNLSALILTENHIETIEMDAFSDLKNLTLVNLSKNKIVNIDNCFQNLPKLSILSVSKNYIRNLKWNQFKKLQSLAYLDVADNEIDSFDAQPIGSAFPNLRVFKIYGNLVSSIEMKHFASKLKFILNDSTVIYSPFI
jgi:hypothetical protein